MDDLCIAYATEMGLDFVTNETITRCIQSLVSETRPTLPYSALSKAYFDVEDDLLCEFYAHIDKLEGRIKIRAPSGAIYKGDREQLGTYSSPRLSKADLYELARSYYTGGLPCMIHYSLEIRAHMADRTDYGMRTIQKEHIFRVYGEDPTHCCVRTERVTDWSGSTITEDIRAHIAPGNTVRIAVSTDSHRRGNYNRNNVIYFTMLKQLSDTQFLATVYNCYLSEYEDVVVVCDVRAITEIPLTWSGNENLQTAAEMSDAVPETGERISTPEQYPFIAYNFGYNASNNGVNVV